MLAVRKPTGQLWAQQDRHPGDHWRLFRAVAAFVEGGEVLYPGSFVDIAPSFVWASVTYVDSDRRAARFFDDVDGIAALITAHGVAAADRRVAFVAADYTLPLDIPDASTDLLISLSAGFVSEHCTRYLRVGGTLLVNASHGDVAMASIDGRYELAAVVRSRSGRYTVSGVDPGVFLVPKREVEITRELLHSVGRGIVYTTSPFAYLFRRVR